MTARARFVALLLLCAVTVAAQGLTQAQQYFSQGWDYQTGDGGRKVDLEKALQAYLQALRLDPQFYEAHVNAGKIYFRRSDYRRAKVHFSDAIRLARGRDDVSPASEARVSSDLGSCYYKEGNLAEAQRWFRGAIGLDPTLAEAHLNLINLLLSADRRQEARQHMAVAMAQAPDERYGRLEGRLTTKESYSEWLGARWLTDWLPVVLGGVVLGIVILFVRRSRRPGKRRR